MDKNLQTWRDNEKHLPEFLKDFHDQKDFFKFLHEFNRDKESIKDIDWIKGHCYSVDVLLYTLARFGWTLQRSRSQQEFEDLDQMIKEFNASRQENSAQSLKIE